jgi:hypothetical protein
MIRIFPKWGKYRMTITTRILLYFLNSNSKTIDLLKEGKDMLPSFTSCVDQVSVQGS